MTTKMAIFLSLLSSPDRPHKGIIRPTDHIRVSSENQIRQYRDYLETPFSIFPLQCSTVQCSAVKCSTQSMQCSDPIQACHVPVTGHLVKNTKISLENFTFLDANGDGLCSAVQGRSVQCSTVHSTPRSKFLPAVCPHPSVSGLLGAASSLARLPRRPPCSRSTPKTSQTSP
jgi:hypothetical protein